MQLIHQLRTQARRANWPTRFEYLLRVEDRPTASRRRRGLRCVPQRRASILPAQDLARSRKRRASILAEFVLSIHSFRSEISEYGPRLIYFDEKEASLREAAQNHKSRSRGRYIRQPFGHLPPAYADTVLFAEQRKERSLSSINLSIHLSIYLLIL